MKLIERLWTILIIITILAAIPSFIYYPFESHGRVWAIIFASEMWVTVLYNLLFKNIPHKH